LISFFFTGISFFFGAFFVPPDFFLSDLDEPGVEDAAKGGAGAGFGFGLSKYSEGMAGAFVSGSFPSLAGDKNPEVVMITLLISLRGRPPSSSIVILKMNTRQYHIIKFKLFSVYLTLFMAGVSRRSLGRLNTGDEDDPGDPGAPLIDSPAEPSPVMCEEAGFDSSEKLKQIKMSAMF
jgi:hypothetical protein